MPSTPKGLSDEKAARVLVAALPLLEANRKAGDKRKGERHRSRTHCKHGHTLADARVYFLKGYIQRDCRTCWKIRSKRGGTITPEVLGKVTVALKHGATIKSFTGAGSSTYLVMHSTFSRHRRENPEFDRFVAEATKDNMVLVGLVAKPAGGWPDPP